jgi:hypothetical protein
MDMSKLDQEDLELYNKLTERLLDFFQHNDYPVEMGIVIMLDLVAQSISHTDSKLAEENLNQAINTLKTFHSEFCLHLKEEKVPDVRH